MLNIDGIFKRMDRLFDAVDRFFTETIEPPPYKEPGAPLNRRKHRIASSGGHITINGDFKSITVNGKLLRFQEAKKK